MKKKYVITGLTCLFIFVSGICYSCAYHNSASTVLTPDQNMEDKSAKDQSSETADIAEQAFGSDSLAAEPADSQVIPTQKPGIYVHICGAVMQPGVYQVEEGSRLVDLIKVSGVWQRMLRVTTSIRQYR
jgi:competence protein ComEA